MMVNSHLPTTDYNEAIQHLQRSRGIISIAKQAESVSPSRQLSSQPTTTMGHSLSAATVETQTSLVTAPTAVTEDKSLDYEDMSVDEMEDESPTEIGQILDELRDGFENPTY